MNKFYKKKILQKFPPKNLEKTQNIPTNFSEKFSPTKKKSS
jgi:hypothetical protein